MSKKKKKRSKKRPGSNRQKPKFNPVATGIDAENIKSEFKNAVQYHRSGDIKNAELSYRRILKIMPNHPDALHLLGKIMSDRGNHVDSIRLIGKAIQVIPGSDIFYNSMGNALARSGQPEKAVEAYGKAHALKPTDTSALNNMGNVLKRNGKIQEAINCFQRALRIDPERAELYNDLGNTLTEMGCVEEGISCYEKAIALKPGYAKACNNMGGALKIRERYAEAVEYYCKAVEANPDYAEAFNNLGATLADMGRSDAAIKFFQKALELQPDSDLAIVNLFCALQRTCTWSPIKQIEQRLGLQTRRALESNMRPVEDVFLNLSRQADPAVNQKVAQAWSQSIKVMMSRIETDFSFEGRRSQKGPLTLGYLSNNFRNHPTGHLMAGMFRLHDRAKFKIHCYSCGKDDQSEFRKRIELGADRFIDIRQMSHLEAAQAIYMDKVDILIDLMGYTQGGRVEISALRPAPVQARYLGMAGTTGAGFFDYQIADKTVVPVEHQTYYSEKLVYLPGCYQVNDYQSNSMSAEFTKESMGLPLETFIFCSFNQAYKLDPIMFDVWMNILKRVDNSILWLQEGDAVYTDNLRGTVEKNDIKGDRIVFGKKMDKFEHLQRLQLADLALDTRIVNGAATTSDALWAGIPVLTHKGDHFSSRMSASILGAVGLDRMITTSLREYEDLAVKLAQNPQELLEVKKHLRVGVETGVLFDTERFTRNIEKGFEGMWAQFISQNKLEPIDIRTV